MRRLLPDWGSMPPHPLRGPHAGCSGACNMRAGDVVVHGPDKRVCRIDECVQDGVAYVTWSDGSYGDVNWRNLSPLGRSNTR